MSEIKFSKEEKSAIVARLKTYFADELDQDIGQFDAEFLLDFFSQEIGPYYYNRALYDAREILNGSVDAINEALYAIEKRNKLNQAADMLHIIKLIKRRYPEKSNIIVFTALILSLLLLLLGWSVLLS